MNGPRRKRILVVNVFFDDFRRTRGSPLKVPRAMGPVFLAGAFSAERCEVRLYNEQASGALHDLDLLAWPDVLVLTGLTSGFDRLLHLTAYARTLNPRVVVVAGGPAVRALPAYSRRFFDYATAGDVEDLQQIAGECLGAEYAAEEVFPRFDLPGALGKMLGYVESSRACNFRCSFCSLTGEKARYRKYDLDYLRRQILATGRRHIVLIDNNFYGNDRDFFLARVELLGELVRDGTIRGWNALVTGDFFCHDDHLPRVREAGCLSLFSGVESFDAETLRSYQKRQNTILPQVEIIRRCTEQGIMFHYGIMLDPTRRSLADLHREIELILSTPEIPQPAFFTLAIPMLGTPYFQECVDQDLLLPDVPLRSLNGCTLSLRPVDPIPRVLQFVRDLDKLAGYRLRVARHAVQFFRRYRRSLSPLQMSATVVNAAVTCVPAIATSPAALWRREPRRTHFASTEPLDPQYVPKIRLDRRFEPYFRPTMVTDSQGRLTEAVAPDVLSRAGRAALVTLPARSA